jgi:hypothetical protein
VINCVELVSYRGTSLNGLLAASIYLMSSLGNHRIIEGPINSLVVLLSHISKSLILGGLILKIVVDVTVYIVLSSDVIGVLLILGLRTASHRLLLIGKNSECLH